MKLVTFDDVKRAQIAPTQCLDWVSDTLKRKGEMILPPKISLHPSADSFMNTMPCLVTDSNGKKWGGVKVVTRFPLNEPALDSKLILLDCESGEMTAVMDADWITAMRTGAVAAHSIQLFARKGWTEVSIMGLGNTARATMLVLAETCSAHQMRVKLLRYKNQADLFIERFNDYLNITFEVVDTMEELLEGCEVLVSCATYLADDVAPDDAFPEGILVVPVHTRGFTNCDLFFDKVFADDTGHVCHFGNFERFRAFAEVADVISGSAQGRESDAERILAYNIGLSIHDIVFAAKIWDALDKNALTEIDFHQPHEKFWV